jgi:hypothetical protein
MYPTNNVWTYCNLRLHDLRTKFVVCSKAEGGVVRVRGNMSEEKLEQGKNIKFLLKIGKSASELKL